ncbi:phosphate acyltransferase PlsX [Stenotrophobium rhamnosiphilum]|uniref:Phosphate acyltransferase n=1 Tax=Stenotrophobium rhamnosiphilum TaxID=2029166 RepID=A0A2T5MKX0_9GAMM|nr:phosphate acyltransferase PlsX [Stenotrophobium rhamnosiphilum]PTU33209.1 phosphate acyltransferase PlsX [Stenotrophobium rhamnosiphilum]
MVAPVVLSIDAMSGDHGHTVTVDAALLALSEIPELKLILVGDEAILAASLAAHKHVDVSRISIRHASEIVEMHESPSKALRNKKDSSMRVAINLVKEGEAQAAVSAGNTGALMATARFVLKMLPGIERPAIVSAIPSINGHVHMLDLGANAECDAQQLLQFAVMGSAIVNAVHGIERPTVALLNIGEEEIKGNEVIKAAAGMLATSGLNYIGFVEGDGIFLKDVDVVVCDGFVGNIALKTGEGVAKMMKQFMQEEFTRNIFTKAAAAMAMPALKALGKRMDPRHYNGASFAGLNGIVIKSHGSADALAFSNAIHVAVREVKQDVPKRIAALLAATLGSEPALEPLK